MSIFSYNYKVKEIDCDKNGKVKISTLLELFTKAATKDYADRGLPREKLESKNLRFLLMQTAAKIYRLPECDDELKVSTWEVEVDGIYFDRAYEITDENGEKIISADGHWILTDLTHRILSPKKFPYEINTGRPADIRCKRMPKYSLSNFTSGILHSVKTEDIDLNGHVHNTVYADVGCEYMPENFRDKVWTEFHINWRNEAKIGDEWELFTSTEKVLNTDEFKCVGFVGEHHSFDLTIKCDNDEVVNG